MYFPVARQRQIRKMIDKRNPNTKMIYGGSPIGEEYPRDLNMIVHVRHRYIVCWIW